jgi:hypothetical protein
MTIIKDIHSYLKDQDVDIYRSKAPSELGDTTWIVESASPPPNPSLGYYEQYLDIWARFRKTDDARDALSSIMTILHRKASWDTDNYHIYLSVATGMMSDMGQDSEGRNLFNLNFRFIYRELEDE